MAIPQRGRERGSWQFLLVALKPLTEVCCRVIGVGTACTVLAHCLPDFSLACSASRPCREGSAGGVGAFLGGTLRALNF
jgi:hypothetical protein